MAAKKPQRGDLVALRAFSQIKNTSFIPIFANVTRDVPNDKGFWQVVGNAYAGDIFILLEEDPSIHWDGGGWLIQHLESGLKGWVGGKYFKKVR